MAVFYLDVDDEITSAAARIRSAEDIDVALVLPSGSRIATSRINFRLLAREASGRSRRLAIVAPEASARALAASAGLPVFASVVEYEEAHGQAEPGAGGQPGAGGGAEAAVVPPAPPEGTKGRSGRSAARAAAAGAALGAAGAAAAGAAAAGAAAAGAGATGAGAAAAGAGPHARPVPKPAAPGREGGEPATAADAAAAPPDAAAAPPDGPSVPGTPPPAAEATRPAPREGGRPRGAVGASTGLGATTAGPAARSRRWPLIIAIIVGVALLAGAGAAVGYVMLPAATVALQLTAEPVGPVTFTGTADPDVLAVDPETATIPAVRVSVPLSATGTFNATGKRVEETAATGSVRWTNCDYLRSYRVAKGSLVKTATGVAFSTTEGLLLPNATFETNPQGQNVVTCSARNGDVVAVKPGTTGNVAAGTITVIPGGLDARAISVRNPAATSGGARDEYPVVAKKDVDGAIAALTTQIDEELASVAGNPPGQPAGTIAYPETARRGEPVPSVPPADLVGQEVATFDLTLTADGTVVAADPSPLEAIGAARVAAEVPEGKVLREGSVQVSVGDGVAEGELVRYPVVARAEAVAEISEDEVRALVKGKTAAEAEQLLAGYGTVQVTIWPDWASTITTVDPRLDVTVEGVPPADGSPEPTSSPGTSPTPVPPGSPSTGSPLPGTATPAGSPPATAAP